MLGEKCKRDS